MKDKIMSIADSKENNWKNMPCGVPGYETTALEYANMIKHYCNEGKFVLALYYLEAAQAHNVLHRMEFAVQETM